MRNQLIIKVEGAAIPVLALDPLTKFAAITLGCSQSQVLIRSMKFDTDNIGTTIDLRRVANSNGEKC